MLGQFSELIIMIKFDMSVISEVNRSRMLLDLRK